MSKQQSNAIKGIAILMMLWYHLFGIAELTDLCTPLLYIGGEPVARMLARACYPVSFFLILSGYGLSAVYRQGRLTAGTQLRRLTKLYLHYWVILLIFVSLGHYLRPDIYILDLPHLAANITGFHCTYNGETWFLLPYSIICMLAVWFMPMLFRIDNKRKALMLIAGYAVCFVAVKMAVERIYNIFFIQVVFLITNFFYFTLGVALYRLINHLGPRFRFLSQWQSCLLLLLLIVVKSQFKVTLADGLYAFAFISLLLQLRVNRRVSTILQHLGRHSMPMWMTHTFFAVYLFQDFIYGFRYPLVIFLVLVAVSYLSAVIIQKVTSPLIKLFRL